MGVAVEEKATVHLTNNDLSFNQMAVTMYGQGEIRDNVMWGNLGHPIELPHGVASCPSCCSVSMQLLLCLHAPASA